MFTLLQILQFWKLGTWMQLKFILNKGQKVGMTVEFWHVTYIDDRGDLYSACIWMELIRIS